MSRNQIRIQAAAAALADLIDEGTDYETAESRIVSEFSIDDYEFPRVLETYAMYYAHDDG